MKKLFTLVALLACFLGANAQTKTVVDFEQDYSTAKSWQHGWLNEEEHLVFEQGVGLHFQSTEAQEQFYSFQYQLHPGISPLNNDASYTITIRIKGTVAQGIHASFSGSNTPGMIPITTDWVDVVLENCVNDPNAQYFASSGSLLIQPGDYVGEFWISYIKITHEEDEGGTTQTWLQMLTDTGNPEAPEGDGKYVGDAEFGQWPAWALQETDGINANWRTDNAGKICAWALTMGTNFDDGFTDFYGEKGDRARPYPAPIEVDPADPNNHVFAAHVTQIAAIGDDAASIAWSNQFWIQSPKEWKTGTQIHIKFDYKADHACSAGTQIHTKYPSKYKYYEAIGNVEFEEDWKHMDKTIVVNANQGDPNEENPLICASLAFNLCSDETNGRTPNTFYFDNLSWEVLKLEDGLFVASTNTKTGIPAYDVNAAIEFALDPEESTDEQPVYYAIVGTEGKEDTWVNEVMISTVRGDKSAFNGATIKLTGKIVSGEWTGFIEGSSSKIKLPSAGVWKIQIDPKTKEICFTMIEGEAPAEAVDIVTNTTEFVVNGVEREDLKDDLKEGVITVREDADDPEGQTVGGEGHNGQAWDNQFWIAANRDLEAGEVTVLKFKYKSSVDAKTTTQDHKMGDGKPCTYMHWASIGDVNFAAGDWKEYEKVFTVPAEANGMRSITFNMAELKGACDYYITDVQWYLQYDEEGKTSENLINATGTDNFWVKIGANTAPYQYGTDPTGIQSVTSKAKIGSAALYNLAGQRVANDYKGIVVKEGKKFVNK